MGERRSLILIVDDEPSVRSTLEALLYQEGHDLAFASSGREALVRLGEAKVDVLLLDVMMPGMDGFEVCQHLKTDDRYRHIPVILVTALDSKEDLVRGLDAGADEFLTKPVGGVELRARVRSMLRIKQQYDELQAALRLREDLANMIVHDMRSPLTSIIGYGELLQDNLTEPGDLKDMDVVLTQARRLNSFANDMLMLAKVQAGKPIVMRSAVDMNQLVEAAGEVHSVIARSRGLDLVVDLPDESQQVSLDANLIQRVLDNLVSNALKFSPQGSTITLRVEYPGPETESGPHAPTVRIQVADEGPGVPAEHRERVFDQFEIVELKKTGVRQVGLGLAFCGMVVKAHGGRITVDDNEPRGAVFTVEL